MGKCFFIKRGQRLTIESLQDGVTGHGFFLLKDEEGNAVMTSEIVTADGVTFTADERKRVFSKDTIEYSVYLSLKQHLSDGSEWEIEHGTLKDIGEVQYMLTKNIAQVVSDDLGISNRIGTNTMGVICRSLGMRYSRTASGYAVVLEEQDMQAAEAKFDLSEAELARTQKVE